MRRCKISTAELKLNGTTIISESGGTATLQNTTLDSGVTIPSNLDIEAASKTAFNATGNAPVYACRAWVNFNGTGTVAIRASGNVSSITDNGTGNYTVNFTNAMPDANYGALAGDGAGGTITSGGVSMYFNNYTTTSVDWNCKLGINYIDFAVNNVAIFR